MIKELGRTRIEVVVKLKARLFFLLFPCFSPLVFASGAGRRAGRVEEPIRVAKKYRENAGEMLGRAQRHERGRARLNPKPKP